MELSILRHMYGTHLTSATTFISCEALWEMPVVLPYLTLPLINCGGKLSIPYLTRHS